MGLRLWGSINLQVHPAFLLLFGLLPASFGIQGSNHTKDNLGDGGPATKARVNLPGEVAVDPSGNVYFVEGAKDRIRRIDAATGTITTVAGTGHKGFSGDGRLAINTSLNNPSGIAIDQSGNLFVSEYVSQRVRRVDARSGVITTFAGNGLPHRPL